MKPSVTIAIAAILTGCATQPPAVPPSAAHYHAAGTEPFWSLTIDDRAIAFSLAGSRPVRQRTPKVIIGFAGEIYRTARIDVNIVHGECSDGMSDRTYPDKVQVTVDGHRYSGCGGL